MSDYVLFDEFHLIVRVPKDLDKTAASSSRSSREPDRTAPRRRIVRPAASPNNRQQADAHRLAKLNRQLEQQASLARWMHASRELSTLWGVCSSELLVGNYGWPATNREGAAPPFLETLPSAQRTPIPIEEESACSASSK